MRIKLSASRKTGGYDTGSPRKHAQNRLSVTTVTQPSPDKLTIGTGIGSVGGEGKGGVAFPPTLSIRRQSVPSKGLTVLEGRKTVPHRHASSHRLKMRHSTTSVAWKTSE